MSQPQPEPDGNLPAARTQLNDAIAKLIDPKPETLNNEIVWTDSPYQQLTESIPGFKQHRSGVPTSQAPLWIDATMLLTEIDTQIRRWQPNAGTYDGDLTPQHPPTPATIRRLQIITGRKWRPQDVPIVTDYAEQLAAWLQDIDRLLTDEHPKHLPAPCPACGTKTIHRKDSAGEQVRQPALQITTHGCQCQACKYTWGPERFMILAQVLGYQLPEGVLE